MKKILILIIILFSTTVKSQTDSTGTLDDSSNDVSPFELMIGTKQFNSTFYDQIKTIDNFKIYQPVNFVGLGLSGNIAISRAFSYWGHIAFLYAIPQDIKINSQNGKLTGFMFSCSVFGIDILRKKKNADLIISVGFNTGRLRIYQNELLRQKNPFFAPMISFHPKFTIKKVSLGLNIQLDYDLSRPNWRKTYFANTNKTLLDNFKQTGLTTLFFIGYTF